MAGLKRGWLHKRMLKIAPVSSGKQKANTDSINHSVRVPNVDSGSPSNKQAIRARRGASTRTSRCWEAASMPAPCPCPAWRKTLVPGLSSHLLTADGPCLRAMAQTVPSQASRQPWEPPLNPPFLQTQLSSELRSGLTNLGQACLLRAGGLGCGHRIDAIPKALALASGSPFPGARPPCCPGLIKTFYPLGPLRVTRDDFQGLENNI